MEKYDELNPKALVPEHRLPDVYQDYKRYQEKLPEAIISSEALQTFCIFCQKPFVRLKNLTRHIKTMHVEKKYACQNCGVDLKVRYWFHKHLREMSCLKQDYVHPTAIQCSVCTRSFFSQNGLSLHLSLVHNIKGLKNHARSASCVTLQNSITVYGKYKYSRKIL